MTRLLRTLIFFLPFAAPALGEVSGRVVDSSGEPVAEAQVEDVASGDRARTGRDGSFLLETTSPPARLRVTKAGFREALLQVGDPPREAESIRLERLETTAGEITVNAGSVHHTLAPASLAVSSLEVAEAGPGVSSVTEIAAESAAVSENGQGGLFQVISIRGISGQRVRSLVAGARIVGERRAGVSASFLDPQLLGSVEVVRGPSSSFYGSGALGGVLQLVPRSYEASSADLGYETEGDEGYSSFGWGDAEAGWSLGLAHRRAGNAETPRGQPLNTRYRQTSASLAKTWEREGEPGRGRVARLRLLSSWGSGIGKSNADFPQEVTRYPQERHLLATFSLVADRGWRFNAYLHPNDLETEDLAADGSRALVENRAVDFGLGLRQEWQALERGRAQVGVEAFSRRGVTADERRTSPAGFEERFRTLDDGSLDEVGAFGSLRWQGHKVSVEGGGRVTWQRQSNEGAEGVEDTAGSAFAGVVVPLIPQLELAVNAGTGLRFPSLSERFFDGTTGRGRVIGEPGLDPERSVSGDIGLRWFGQRHYVALYAFRNEIDDYIERVQVEPGLRTFRNLTGGTLEGLEIDALYRISTVWRLSLQGHRLRGRSDGGAPLADVPPDRVTAGIRGRSGGWGWDGRWQIRQSKDDPAEGEQAIDGGHLVSLSLARDLPRGLLLRGSVTNLLDEDLFLSADDLATESPGRSWGLHLSWRG